MPLRVSQHLDLLFTRDFPKDFVPSNNTLLEFFTAALTFAPFVSTNNFNGRRVTAVFSNSLRCYTSVSKVINTKDFISGLHVVLSIANFAASIFDHKIGIFTTAFQEIITDLQGIHRLSLDEVLKRLTKIAANLVYLLYVSKGGLELSIIAFLLQSIVSLIHATEHDSTILCISSFCMGLIRLKQAYGQYTLIEQRMAYEKAVKRVHVGPLGEKYRLCTDYLPIGVEVDGTYIMNANLLDTKNIDRVDAKGLTGSWITEKNIPAKYVKTITNREAMTITNLGLKMPCNDIIALQECSDSLIANYLTSSVVRDGYELIRSEPDKGTNAFLYWPSKFTAVTSSTHNPTPDTTILQAQFTREDGSKLNVLNVHIPEGHTGSQVAEVLRFVQAQNDHVTPTVVIGSFDTEGPDLAQAAMQVAQLNEFSLHTPWHSTLNSKQESVATNSALVLNTNQSEDLSTDDLFVEYPDLFESHVNKLKKPPVEVIRIF